MSGVDPIQTNTAGWYGKMPSLGDFGLSNLPKTFVTPWDNWLQRCLHISRSMLGEQWLDIYLESPIWRFVLSAGICGQETWTGVLMPSVDRVGRYFPFTIAVPVDPLIPTTDIVEQKEWFNAIEQTALSFLNQPITPAEVELALNEHPFPLQALKEESDIVQSLCTVNGELVVLPIEPSLGRLLTSAAQQQPLAKTLWWTTCNTDQPVVAATYTKLPEARRYVDMLSLRVQLS